MFGHEEEGIDGGDIGWWKESRLRPRAGLAMIHFAISWMEGFE